MLSYKLAKQSKPLTDGEYLKDCGEAASILCPDNKGQFVTLSAELLNKGNLRKVLNVVFNPSPTTVLDLALITLDAVKAFDKVEGDYFFFFLV